MPARISVFLDTSALFAGIWSAKGGSRMILKLGEAGVIRLLVSPQVLDEIESDAVEWAFFQKGKFRENLFAVPHHSLVLVGAYGHGAIKEAIFGSMMEEIQTVLPNNMLIVGPHCACG